MAIVNYNISDLLEPSDQTAVYDLDNPKNSAAEAIYKNNIKANINSSNLVSYLGTPIIFPVTFEGGTYNYYDNGLIRQKRVESLTLPATTIVDFRRSKIKKKTRIGGGNGSVKELYGLDDWKIRLRGLILDEGTGEFPEETLLRLKEFEGLADAVKVSGKIFNLLSIYMIDIDELTLPSVKGYPNVRPFVISAESNEPIELIIRT